jgi:gamma-glutamylcyclotransferase (GGCT)/AIG2-like uncharacterized protein YtfP
MRPLPDHLFVYGTLRRLSGSPMAPRIARETTVVATGSVGGRLYDAGAYPALIVGTTHDSRIHGELLHLPDDKLRRRRLLSELDLYEGVIHGPGESLSLFLRTVVDVRVADGGIVPAWTYVYNRDVSLLPVIEDGDWVSRRLVAVPTS